MTGDAPPPLADAAEMMVDAIAIDAPVPVDEICLGGFVNACVARPTGTLMLTTQTIDTSSSSLCLDYRSTPALDACVIAATSLVIPGNHTVTVTGRRPLILISTGSITISGVLDAASHVTGASGPGADAGPCPSTARPPTAGPGGDGGGGHGGSFGGSGNNGGNGALVGNGGTAAPAFLPTGLRGGCPASDGAGTGGARGRGGGAVLLVAAQTLTIDGTVNASGAAGRGGTTSGGGGGGGSGGMIVLDADTVNTPGKCFATGGGGGEGANAAADGAPGADPTAPGTSGSGGRNGTSFGGDGGDGAAGAIPGGSPGNNGTAGGSGALGGGGGGGGGTGVIKVFARQQNNTSDISRVAPRPT